GEVDEALGDWWQEFSTGDDQLREDLVDQVRQETQKRARGPKVQRAPAPEGARRSAADAGAIPPSTEAGGEDAPRPKRRRRRRTGGAGGSGAGDAAPRSENSGE
ncbi:MAG: polynucleotide adenylyltransferase PcnB, partial [Rhodoferax sp.]